MNLPIIYGQRDYNDKLGTSNVTIAGYGCAITSLAMLLEYCGIHVTPPELNRWLTNYKSPSGQPWGYASGNLVIWDAINAFSKNKLIYQGMKKTTYPCIAEVDLIPTNSKFDQHFVVALDDKMCADPWEKRVRPLSDFGGVKSYRGYSLPAVPTQPSNPSTGGSMDNSVFKDAFLELVRMFNDQYDESWNPDQKKAWVAQKKQRIADAIRTAQNPPVSSDPQLQAKYDNAVRDLEVTKNANEKLNKKISDYKIAHSNLFE